MKITFLSLYYWPEPAGIAPLAAELAEGLAARGHDVAVVTGFPNYPARRVAKEYRGRLFARERIRGVRVFRTWVHVSSERNGLLKILNHGSFTASCVAGLLAAGRPDVIACFSPPLTLALPAMAASATWGVPHVFLVQDLLPEAAVTFGLLRNRLLIAAMERLERAAYRQATRVVVISEGFRRNLLGKGVPDAKIDLVYNWVDTERVRPMPRENAWRHARGLNGDPVVLYAGNMGFSQGLDRTVDAAAMLAREGVKFLFVGDGTQKAELVARVRETGATNAFVLPVEPQERMPEVLAAADLLLVSQKGNVLDINLPSKIPVYLAAGRPMIAAVNPHGDAARIARECGGAVWVPPEDPAALAAAVRGLLADPARRQAMSQAARAYAERHFRRETAVERYETSFEAAHAAHGG